MIENTEEREIDLLGLANKLWEKRKSIIKLSFIGLVIGIIIAFSIPKEYKTTVILKTDSAQSTPINMSALASMTGINLGGNAREDILSPDLYPDVLKSTPFIQGLFNINIIDSKEGINTTLFEYFKEYQSAAWWMYIIKAPTALLSLSSGEDSSDSTSTDSRSISRDKMLIINAISNVYNIRTDQKTGVTTLEVTAQNPVISAFLADTLTSYLQSYIIEERTKKAKNDLENSEKLYLQSKKDYYETQQKLATFMDGNLNITSARYKINQEKLQNETNTAYTVFNQMAQQVQMSKIRIQDNTPVFTIIQPAIEPLNPSKPKKKIIVIASLFLAFVGGCGWVLAREYLNDIITKK